jgi:hypothetical protein
MTTNKYLSVRWLQKQVYQYLIIITRMSFECRQLKAEKNSKLDGKTKIIYIHRFIPVLNASNAEILFFFGLDTSSRVSPSFALGLL